VKIENPEQVETFIELLSTESAVEYAERVPLPTTGFTPNDLGANTVSGQYGLHITSAENAWDVADGSGRTIAIVDNAFFLNHPDLVNKYGQGFDAADNDTDPSAPNATFTHGTHVAGIAGAETDNGLGLSSMGYEAKLMPIKATQNSVPHYWITHGYEGIVAAANMGAHVINCSWGGSVSSTTGANAVTHAHNVGAIVVAAAGNSGNTQMNYPAAYVNVVAVVSTNINDQKSGFSSYGNWVSVCAPGENIQSTLPNANYGSMSGTSMASPMVAGLCALVWSVDPGMLNNDVVACVLNTADNIDAQNPSLVGLLGTGRINAERAVNCASACPTTIVLVSPTDDISTTTALDFEADLSIEASNVLSVNTDVDYDAGEYILMTDGFFAQASTTFHAFIDGCNGLMIVDEEDPSFVPTEQISQIHINVPSTTGIDLGAAPNPFAGETTITYNLPEEANVQIHLFDARGQLIQPLSSNQMQDAGTHTLHLKGDELPSGMYYCRVIVDQKVYQLSIVKK
jgi:hypothetical protein